MRKEKKAVLMDTSDQMQFDQTLAVRILGCSYEGSNKHYSFFCANPRIEVDDLVVARDKNGFRLVTVRKIVPPESPAASYANNWIIGSIADMMKGLLDQLGKLQKVKDDKHHLFMRTTGWAMRQRMNDDTETTMRHFRQFLDTPAGNFRFRPARPLKPYSGELQGFSPTGRIMDEWVLSPFQVQSIMDVMRHAGATEFLENTVLTHVNEKGERVLGIPLSPRPGMVLQNINFADLGKHVMARAAATPQAESRLHRVGFADRLRERLNKTFAQDVMDDAPPIICAADLATKEGMSDDERPAEGFTIYGEE